MQGIASPVNSSFKSKGIKHYTIHKSQFHKLQKLLFGLLTNSFIELRNYIPSHLSLLHHQNNKTILVLKTDLFQK
jgi:hypothetical protein